MFSSNYSLFWANVGVYLDKTRRLGGLTCLFSCLMPLWSRFERYSTYSLVCMRSVGSLQEQNSDANALSDSVS